MDDPTVRPLAGDPGAPLVQQMLDSVDQLWLAGAGEIATFGVESFRDDGTDHQVSIAIAVPTRRNHDHAPDATKRTLLLLAPEDALELALQLAYAGRALIDLYGPDGGGDPYA